MIETCTLHDDLEYFASYLGIEYDDYYEMIYNLDYHEDDEDDEIDYTLGLTD